MWNLKFICMTELFHMCAKISHVIKCMEKKFTHDKIFSHVLQNFTRMSKSSYACEMPMCSHGSFFHTLFTWFSHTALVVRATMKFSRFSSNEEDFCLPSSFSVIHVSVNIKNNIEKLTTFFFSLSLQKSGWPCDFLPLHLGCQTCSLSYFILVCLSCRWTVSHSGGVWSRDYQIF